MINEIDKRLLPKAIASSRETPLKLGEVSIDCYVLNDENRTAVLSLRGAETVLGFSNPNGTRLKRFSNTSIGMSTFGVQLKEDVLNPIKFLTDNNIVAHGISASTLIDICIAISTSEKCAIQMRAMANIIINAAAKTGITAMIYEATGYEREKDKSFFQSYFKFILADEARKWENLFNESGFLDDLAKMKCVGWAKPGCYPKYFGKMINEFVYSRIAPGLELELDSKNPMLANKHRRFKHHQFFQEDGKRIAREHLNTLHALAKASNYDFDMFKMLVDRVYPNKANNQ